MKIQFANTLDQKIIIAERIWDYVPRRGDWVMLDDPVTYPWQVLEVVWMNNPFSVNSQFVKIIVT